jgi:hypothetical protein
MRRIALVLALAFAGVVVAVYLGGRGSNPPTSAINLVAQESPNTGVVADLRWKATRHLSLTCGATPAAAGSTPAEARAVCHAVAYYSHHVPTRPCVPIGPIPQYRRVLITGSLDGQPLHLAMGLVCNPPPALGHATDAIYSAAFR